MLHATSSKRIPYMTNNASFPAIDKCDYCDKIRDKINYSRHNHAKQMTESEMNASF